MASMNFLRSFDQPLAFVRHGTTQPNLDGLRCGGDLDVPLADAGLRQVASLATQLGAMDLPFDVIVTSDLQRTRASAEIIASTLGGLPIVVLPALRERMLGTWNLQTQQATEVALRRGDTPPGGEPSAAFAERVAHAMSDMRTAVRGRSLPVLVGSRGIARVLRTMHPALDATGARRAELHDQPACNAELIWFDMGARASCPVAQVADEVLP